jgi:hypothetical protein
MWATNCIPGMMTICWVYLIHVNIYT